MGRKVNIKIQAQVVWGFLLSINIIEIINNEEDSEDILSNYGIDSITKNDKVNNKIRIISLIIIITFDSLIILIFYLYDKKTGITSECTK